MRACCCTHFMCKARHLTEAQHRQFQHTSNHMRTCHDAHIPLPTGLIKVVSLQKLECNVGKLRPNSRCCPDSPGRGQGVFNCSHQHCARGCPHCKAAAGGGNVVWLNATSATHSRFMPMTAELRMLCRQVMSMMKIST